MAFSCGAEASGFYVKIYCPPEPPEIPEENLTCDYCGQEFDTVEPLSEVKDSEMKQKRMD
jgi:hypothetical protein